MNQGFRPLRSAGLSPQRCDKGQSIVIPESTSALWPNWRVPMAAVRTQTQGGHRPQLGNDLHRDPHLERSIVAKVVVRPAAGPH